MPPLVGQYDDWMDLSFSETGFLFFLALLLFGPKKLPEIGRQVGKILNDFKRASNEFRSQIEAEIATLERDTGIGGLLLTFVDFVPDVERFGDKVLPLVRERYAAITRAA